MKLRHIIIIVIFIAINIAVVMTLDFGKPPIEEEETKSEYVQELEAIEVENYEEQFNVVGYGTISSFNAVDISSEVQGKLLAGSHDLKPGIRYRKGELLFRISDRDARYNLRSRKSGFITILAQLLPDIKIDFPEEYDKWNDYVNSIKLNKELPTLPVWKSDKEKVYIAIRNVLTEYFAIKSQEELLRKYKVYSPYNCVITEVYVAEHSIVGPSSKIVRIAQADNFELEVPLPVTSLPSIKVGTKGQIYTTEGTLKGVGTVVRISEVINKTTQSVNVFLKPQATDGNKFIEGEYVKVEINETGNYKGTRLPNRAIQEGKVFIYSKSDSSLNPISINVLDKNEKGTFVSGIENGEIVITQEVLNYSDSLKYGVVLKKK